MHNVTVAFAALLVMLLSYFFGCFNGSFMVSHFIIRDDVRKHGSGNAGLTNFYRTYGAKYALGVILFDMGKTVIACLIGGAAFDYLAGDWMLGVLLGGLGCELGHMFPVFFGFKGGKGILSGGTLVWLLDWRVGLIAWGLFAALWLLTKYVSLGSVCAAASMPVTTFFFCGRSLLYTALAVLIAALVIFLSIELIQVGQRLSEARQQQAALERQLQMQTQENQALESDLAKKDDEEFIKDLARDQLGLAEEGERIFYDVND